jgi:hypothetical protein
MVERLPSKHDSYGVQPDVMIPECSVELLNKINQLLAITSNT